MKEKPVIALSSFILAFIIARVYTTFNPDDILCARA